MKVITNAGPLINLGKLGLTTLLHELYGIVLIPSAVYKEVVTLGITLGQPDAYATQLAIARREMTVIEANDEDLSPELQALPLGGGEKHTIHLAMKAVADLALMDDLLARQEAERLACPTGS